MFNYKIKAMKKNLILLFCLLLSISAKAQVVFGSKDTLTTLEQGLIKVVAADINGDGILDAVTADSLGNSGTVGRLMWYENINDGTKKFANSTIIADGEYFATIDAGDIDGDGDADIVTLSLTGTNGVLKWYSNDGTGNFTFVKSFKTYYSQQKPITCTIKIVDLDNDNYNDVVISTFQNNNIAWFRNVNGDGQTWTEQTIGSSSIIDFAISDIDKDGKLDVVVADNDFVNNRYRVIWYKNDIGNTPPWSINTFPNISTTLSCIYTEDLNNDNLDDIIFGIDVGPGVNDPKIVWYENSQGGPSLSQSYKTIYTVPTSSIPGEIFKLTDVQAADLNLDGKQDLIFSSDDNYVRTMTNTGNGTFEDARTVSNTVNNPVSIFAADLDSVQDIDLLVASQDDNTVSYFNNYTPIITQDPQDAQPVCVGTDSVLFTVKAINARDFKWLENSGTGFGSISQSDSHYHGVTSDTLYVDAWYANMNGYQYKCEITGYDPAYSKDTSNFAKLYVDENVTANAGSDKSLCEAGSQQLSANDPTPNTGMWTSNTSGVSFINNTVYNTMAQNLVSDAAMEMYWTIDNGACGLSVDTMLIKNYKNFTANAGADETICDSIYQLQGNTAPVLSVATWTCARSEVTFDDAHNPGTMAYNLPGGNANESRFKWEVINGACGNTSDFVSIFRNEPIIADAGDDISLCEQSVTSLYGNDPGYHSTHYWTSSNPQIIFSDSTQPQTGLSNIPHGSTTLTWTIDVPACGKTSDELILASYNSINIETEPFNLTVNEGEDALFGIVVSGDVKTYQWHKGATPLSNDARISGTNTDTLFINNVAEQDTGTYKCIITDMCYGNETSTNEVQLNVNASSTGLDALKAHGINIYPNPNTGIFKITNDKAQIDKVKIYDLEGKCIYLNNAVNDHTTRIDISSYDKGVYILEIMKKNKIIRSKLIVQ